MDPIFQFIQAYGTNPIVVAAFTVLATVLVQRAAPWLWNQAQHFGAWVLALFGGRIEDHRFEREYLKELIGHFASLGLLQTNVTIGVKTQSQTAELERVFVELSLTSSGGVTDAEARSDEMELRLPRYRPTGWRRLIPVRFRRDDEQPQSNLGRAIQQHPRLVIRGDPGSGKTTLMKYLAVTCARALRNDRREGDRRDLVWERLGWKERLFPIFISLGRHANVLEWDKEHSLLDACEQEFAHGLKDCPAGFFERRLKRGNCLLLLDAFDEIGSRTGRNAMAQEVAGMLTKCAHSRNHIVVTTRIVGYEGQLDSRDFAVQTVQPLSRRQINDLVQLRYRAIAINATANRPPSEAQVTEKTYARKAEQLLTALHNNLRLSDLAENPLLLSLIVTIHNAKVELPEQRHILYRDCTEIFAHDWQRRKKEELFLPTESKDELTLENKLSLLRAIALTMQQQRTDKSQAPILRRDAEALIAAQLPQFLAAQLPTESVARAQESQKKAAEWMEGIKQQSGILEEAGFDPSGEPLVRFSHLTFQEYLCAAALEKERGLPSALLDNLLNEVWEEVLLLYAAMSSTEKATEIIQRLLAGVTPANPRGLLVAARSLADKVTLAEREHQRILDGLHGLIRAGAEADRVRGCELLMSIGVPQSKPLLVQVADNDLAWSVRYAAAQTLGRLGDPRFEHDEPEMVGVPAGEFMMGTSDAGIERLLNTEETKEWAREWKEKGYFSDEQPQHSVTLDAFEVGKYPVTNVEYKRFVDESSHAPPRGWEEGGYPEDKANHPVVTVSWHDAQAYCQWLSQKTGKPYRLPTEAEWEKAARGDDGRMYPWGNEFDKAKCNTYESGIGMTTPVGIYVDGASPCGAADMAGNVWEWCADWYDENYYKNSPDRNPTGAPSGQLRTLRGGSWLDDQQYARGAFRYRDNPDLRLNYVGFRCARSFSS